MPNWCYNSVYITGTKEDLDKIQEIDFDFEKIIPMPQSLKEDADGNNLGGRSYSGMTLEEQKIVDTWKKEYGCDGWYSWSNEHWGTKWNASSVEIRRESDTVLIGKFDTAWGPPEPILKALSKQYPQTELEFSYNLEGSDPCITYKNGKEC